MGVRRLYANAVRWALVQAMSVALRLPRVSDWLAARIRRFPWLYLKLVALFSEQAECRRDKPLVAPDLTPATKEVLDALCAELARPRGGHR